jgi:hypothetical protein
MISTMRKKFGPIVIGIIIGFIAFVFIFEFGMNRSGNGAGGATFAGSVNGEPITYTEFNRDLNRKLEFFKSLSGGQLSEEMIKQYKIRESVFRELAGRKLMIQEAEKIGLLPSDGQIRDQIFEIPAFKKDGKFDRQHYKEILQANNYTPATFEKMIRDDLISQLWRDHFRSLARFSEEEVKREYLMSNEKRKLRYVLLSFESGRKRLKVAESEVESFLKDPAKANLAKARFEELKSTQYKGKTYEQVQKDLARDLVGEEKTGEIRRLNNELGDRVAKVLTADSKSDGAVNGILKETGLKVQATSLMARGNFFVPGAGDAKSIEEDAFSGALKGTKKYDVAGGVLVAVVAESASADISKLVGNEREQMITRIVSRKENELYGDWMKNLEKKSKIEQNPQIAGSGTPDEG